MAWKLAKSIEQLRKEVNAAYPNRPKQTDGTIGDASHASTGNASDHNPWLNNTVRAWDITTSTFSDDLAEKLRRMGAAGDKRLVGGGMVIFKRRIANDREGWAWRPYGGSDPHASHIHLSVTRNAQYDDASPWGVFASQPGGFPMALTDAEQDKLRDNVTNTKKQLDEQLNPLRKEFGDFVKEVDSRLKAIEAKISAGSGPASYQTEGPLVLKPKS